ncbi:MAG: phytanoyl-CoA dioxygenase family protein [Hyphomicrobiales bacterium]|nr:phytanoyl-CoA dioxygenase family protein [Hyphomicrobiales bacterium]
MATEINISEADIAAFERDGAIVLRGVFDVSWLDSLAEGLERNFADPGPCSTVYTPDGQPGGFYDDYCNWQRIPEYKDFVLNSPAGEVVGRLMRSQNAKIYHEHVLVKEPGTKEVTPWHHDLPYYGVDGDQLASIWLPLDPVPQSACPEFVAGSHNSGKMYYPKLFISHENYGAGVEGFETIPDIDNERDQRTILSWDLEPGDCIVFHMRTLHGAPSTAQLKTRRRGFSTRWLGDDAYFTARPWKTSPPFPEVELAQGAKMDHPSFPVVWQAGH